MNNNNIMSSSLMPRMLISPIIPPILLSGKVVEGFKRGSKLLGFPTANLDPNAFKNKLIYNNKELNEGVYAGWVTINDSCVYKTVLSIGYNPYFKNKEQTVETYILNKFDEDFYGAHMKLIICVYMRPQHDFQGNMDALIAAIKNDEQVGADLLNKEPYVQYKNSEFFKNNNRSSI